MSEQTFENNTITADVDKMRIRQTDNRSNNGSSLVSDLVQAVKLLLSTEDIKQKSRKTINQVWVSSEIRTLNESSKSNFGVINRVTDVFNSNMEEELISLNGAGRLEAIEMVKNLEERAIEENKIKIATKGIQLK